MSTDSQLVQAIRDGFLHQEERDQVVFSALAEYFSSSKLFVDIGARLGVYAKHADLAMDEGRIVAIEADPVPFAELEKNAKAWSQDSSNEIIAYNCAVTDQDGTTDFMRVTNLSVSGGLFQHPTKFEDTVQWEQIKVQCCTLTSLLNNQIPDFVKIDVEGAELRVLRGCIPLLETAKTIFLIEVHPWPDPGGQKGPLDVYRFMEQYGYYPSDVFGQKLFRKSPVFGLRWWRYKVFLARMRLSKVYRKFRASA